MNKTDDISKHGLASNVLNREKFKPHKNSLDSISPLTYNDIEEVARLSQIYFPGSKEVSLNFIRETIEKLYFTDGVLNSNSSSIVSRSKNGSVNGFLGVITNTFRYRDRNINVAHCHHLMATEQARKKLVPIKILQKFLSGPQDLSFADSSSESTRLLWKRLGGEPSIGECIFYKTPLRPASFTLRPFLKKLNMPAKKMAGLFARGIDSVAGKVRIPMFYRDKLDVELRPLHSQVLLEALDKINKKYLLFPDYSQSKVEHLFNLLSREKRYGTLHKFAIVDGKKEIIGWFIYYSVSGGVCKVIQAASIPGREEVLFNSLTRHAYLQGGVELSGRLSVNQLRSSFALKSFCMPARMWTLFHTTDSDLMLDIQTGKAFITRLEGDMWLI